MLPRTKMQKEVIGLSKKLPPITKTQQDYAFANCIKHYAYIGKSKASCLECGNQWKGWYNEGEKCVCPHCGHELIAHETRNRCYKQTDYFAVLTTKEQYQVIRYYQVKVRCKIGKKAEYNIDEVVQRWMDPNGKNAIVARLRSISFFYNDVWAVNSPMEIRRQNQYNVYDIYPYKVYPRMNVIPELKRNGFTGKFYSISPFSLFDAILNNSKQETLLKAGQINLLHHSINYFDRVIKHWPSIKICIRNNYQVEDASLWIDYIEMLEQIGKDIRNPKYVCTDNLKQEHDKAMMKRNEMLAREALEKAKEEIAKNEKMYFDSKSKFFGLLFTDGEIQVKTLRSVQEFANEGAAMHHCVFTNKYYLKDDSLILSATIDGLRVETVEVSLKKMQIIQSRGLCNQNTEYHDRIIELVNKNMNHIKAVV